MLYGSPFGSNDDWYWIYATVKAGEVSPEYSNITHNKLACMPQ